MVVFLAFRYVALALALRVVALALALEVMALLTSLTSSNTQDNVYDKRYIHVL